MSGQPWRLEEPVEVGTIFRDRHQLYRCTQVEPYVRQDGQPSALATWLTRCAECGDEFEFKTSVFGAPRNRRCVKHKRPGVRVRKVHPSAMWPA